jgi:hypothetical protein
VPGVQNVPPGILIALASKTRFKSKIEDQSFECAPFIEVTTVPIIQADVEIDAMNEITMHTRTFLLSEYIA